MVKPEYFHASCVSIEGYGVLLLGNSGAGKSDLALRLIGSGGLLVADDQVILSVEQAVLYASCPQALYGKIEARGIGILTLPYIEKTPLTLAVALVPREDVERMPEPAFFDCFGVQLPLLSLHAFDLSTPDKITLYLRSLAA